MSKKSEIRKRIKKLIVDSHCATEAAFAKRLGFLPTTFNAWTIGTSLPSPEAYMKLAVNARDVEDSLFFCEQAGLTREMLSIMAPRILEEHTKAPAGATIVAIPCFRGVGNEKERAVSLVELSLERVPNPGATIGLEVDEKSVGIVSAPMGLLLIDKSIAGTANVLALDGQDAILHSPGSEGDHPPGIYVGRILCRQREWIGEPNSAFLTVFVELLGRQFTRQVIATTVHEKPRMDDLGPRFIRIGFYEERGAAQDLDWTDEEKRARRFTDLWRRVGANFPLNEGVQFLGKLIGYLPGPIEIMREP